MTHHLIAIALCTAVLVVAPKAYAQPPEAGTAAPAPTADAAQESGAARIGFVAKFQRFADKIKLAERLNGEIGGWYPRLGGMTTGSGFALGPGYRTRLFDDKIFVDVSAGISKKNYQAADVKVEWLQSRYRRVELWTNFRYQNFPQEDFFGLGEDSSLATRTNYALNSNEVSALGIFHARPWLRIGGQLGYFMPSIGSGTDQRYPSTELVFNDVSAPGLAAQPDFLNVSVYAEADFRDQRGNPKRGGFYRASFGSWDDRTLQQFDFHRFDGEAAHFVPLATTAHVLASRLGFAYVNNTTGHRVPFYFLPYIGGHDTVRGYREFRFKEENALWLNVEYRWSTPVKWVGVAVFFDAGEVRPNWEDVDLKNLRRSYGVGFRVTSSKSVYARLDFGVGSSEGRQIFFKLGPSF